MKLYVLGDYSGNIDGRYWGFGVFTIDKLESVIEEYIRKYYFDFSGYYFSIPQKIEDGVRIGFDLHTEDGIETWSVYLYEVTVFE